MTPEEFKALIMAGDAQRLLDTLPNVADSERTALAKVAVSLTRTLETEGSWENNHAQCCAHLAVFGIGIWDQVKRLGRGLTHIWSNDINLYDWIPVFLTARRPDWIERWASHQLADDFNPAWPSVRALVRAGVCPRPADDNYIIRMIHGFWSNKIANDKWQLVDGLRADPDLLEYEIWKIFEVEPPGKGVLIYANDLGNHPLSWSRALTILAAAGEIDRGRLLTESLEALRRGRRAAGATWYFKFHESLQPTFTERLGRQLLYIDLLGNDVPAVVSFSLDALGLLIKDRRFDAQGYLDAVPSVFRLPPKGPSITALKLLSQLVKQQPELKASAAVIVCGAVRHESADVQTAGVKWLEGLKAEPNEAVASELDSCLPSVAPSLRERVAQLSQQMRPSGPQETTEGCEHSRPPAAAQRDSTGTDGADEVALRSEIAGLTEAQRAASGIESALRILETGGELVAAPVEPLRMIHLSPDRELRPIASLDELIEELSVAMETPCDADQFERLLDGLSRLCAQRPADFGMRTAPLLKRADKLSEGFRPGLSQDLGLRWITFILVGAWCQPGSALIETTESEQQTGIEFLIHRVRELIVRVGAGRAAPLLAAPTHRGGWLSAVAFVHRLLEYQRAGLEPDPFDLIQALLRLVPDDRPAASVLARNLQPPFDGIVRFALGGPLDEWPAGGAPRAALWVAALRGRDPSLSMSKIEAGIEGPDVWKPAVRAWHAVARPDPAPADWTLQIEVAVDPAVTPPALRAEFPALQLNYERHLDQDWVAGELLRLRLHWGRVSESHIRWALHHQGAVWGPGIARAILQIWPNNPDPTFVRGTVAILYALDAGASMERCLDEFLEPLFAPHTRFSEMAQLLVAVSLLARDVGLKVYAVDALIGLITDGRCVGDELGSTLRRLLISQAVKCNRLAAQLGEVARVSSLHMHVSARIVQTMFADAAALPHGMLPNDAHHLLAVLLEWLVTLDEPLHAATARVLSAVTGAGKTAKLARSLVARTSPCAPEQRRQVLLASLRGRMERARHCQP